MVGPRHDILVFNATNAIGTNRILWILHLAAFAFGQPPSTTNPTNAHNETALVCLPFGICEPCPDDSLHEPFCQPFGNRRLVHCLPAPSGTPTPTGPHVHAPSATVLGEIPAWESCGRIVERERADFYEFLACNAFLALLAVPSSSRAAADCSRAGAASRG
ncbi:uncharacterized protein BXZ73DRAFT_75091 [Epithele typhae]|uniref:uncharacterized protein n=1 Tax=Epithele typhae TaxID=378194 RepID=UPI00200750DB|nr:uncharacterized protein BXZ73DRAFT_75091 [Epithele typhae]KAH9941119.1 hypothetical protein BXZ73DRAFT_75091 [Epithele typhae]